MNLLNYYYEHEMSMEDIVKEQSLKITTQMKFSTFHCDGQV